MLTCRNMFNTDGTFNEGHMNNWQHAAMYFAYMISGFVDITGFYTELPPDTEQAQFCRTLKLDCLLYAGCRTLHPWFAYCSRRVRELRRQRWA